MSATICPINPPGHDWQAGLVCRWCDATRTPGEAILSGLASVRGWTPEAARVVRDAYRAEVLASDGQAYASELAMLRTLIRTVRVAVRNNDWDAVWQALNNHATDDALARAEARENDSHTADTTPASGLSDVVFAAVSSFQVDRLNPGGYDQQLTAHLVAALVEWGEV
ncbi:hypothetical protein [Streptomyces sp. NPDC005799]|uniref:hypothetical protein n=1 Tax=Streptomyces sp. NPDC005799 TaxID=3154678 RepID=UPI0033E72BA8